MRRLPYVPVGELLGRPNIVVDGAPVTGTVAVISHWPASPKPPTPPRDLSASMALEFVSSRAYRRIKAEAVTNDHFDQDGLVSLLALVDPETALAARGLLEGVASVGDFARPSSPQAERLAFALAAISRSLGPDTPARYRYFLQWLPAALGGTSAEAAEAAEVAAAEEDFCRRSREAVSSGLVALREYPEADLLLASVGPALGVGTVTRFGERVDRPVHPIALHERSQATRVLVQCDADWCLYERYETWVKYVSQRLRPRADLGPLSARLDEAEGRGGAWRAEGPGAIEPVMRPASGTSELPPAQVVELVRAYLEEAPPAWNPFRKGGGCAP